ncbi:MAG: 23S rRNA (adenine(2503)-C(2))-methyltransferase RlmN, partial [Phycisphaerae bacterium]|nr:23S rRNA (adenine(2503)-C(2))-methyltransferase RlmN [Phycisphaerae bacterium]
MKSFHDRRALDEYGQRRGLDPHCLRCARNRFYKKAAAIADVLGALPVGEQAPFARHFSLRSLRLVGRRESGLDGAGKLLWRTEQGDRFESVILRIASGRCSLCVSSQAGCAAGCVFCATGGLGLQRNLSSDQILDQVAGAARLLQGEDRRIRNLV